MSTADLVHRALRLDEIGGVDAVAGSLGADCRPDQGDHFGIGAAGAK